MSGIFSFVSKDDNLTVIDLALDEFLKKQRRQDKWLSFDKNLLLHTSRIELLKENLVSMQRECPERLIGVSMEFFHSCEDSRAFLGFQENLPDPSKIFFYNILPGSDFQARMLADLSEVREAEFDPDSGVLYPAKPENADGKELVRRCERTIQEHLETIVADIVTEQNPPAMLASSCVYVSRYVDIKRLFMNPDALAVMLYYLSRYIVMSEEDFDALVATSKNGAVLAELLGRMTSRKVVNFVNIGPQYALSASAVEQIERGKRYLYVYDFICLGTEAKLLHALLASHSAVLADGIGVASYIPLDNPELKRKHSPLAKISSMVNLISAGIPYQVYMQGDTAGPRITLNRAEAAE